MELSQYYKVVGAFDHGTKIMVDRDYIDISGIEYKIIELSETETTVQITIKGLKELKKKVRKWLYDFMVDDLESRLYFGADEDLEPHVFKQVRSLIK